MNRKRNLNELDSKANPCIADISMKDEEEKRKEQILVSTTESEVDTTATPQG